MQSPVTSAELDGVQLANALRAGIYRLFERTDHINKINVFPVPDGDTGTNMSMTLSAVLAVLNRAPEAHAGSLLIKAADAALDGARGNSGAILAQFLLGIGDHAGHLAKLGRREFVAAISKGASYARDALSQPREGTLLTVLREFAQASEASLAHTQNFAELFAGSLVRVRTALEATRLQLDELRHANVVDAGALGFVEVLEGMRRFLETGDVGSVVVPQHSSDEVMVDAGPVANAQDYRYCTECLVLGGEQDIDLRQLRETLALSGASLVVSGSKRKARIHIHADDPEQIFRIAGQFGSISGQKADDMRAQQSAAHHTRTQRVAIVTDSGADIPEAEIERLGILTVPVRIHFGTRSYLDKVSMTPQEFYRELTENPLHPKTSQPPPGDFRRMFEFLVSHYDAVVSVNLTSRHSGTHDAACAAAQRVSSAERPVVIIDSLNASVGQGLIAIAAAEAAAKGGTVEQVREAGQSARQRVRSFALLKDIDFAVKGGRVPALVGKVAKLLRLNVILVTHPDGRIAAGSGLIGSRSLRQRFGRYIARQARAAAKTGRLRILVGHADRAAEAESLRAELRELLSDHDIEWLDITEMSPAVGVHGGPGTLIVGIQQLS
jgi:DegV family protein with EDD domain